jgi:hypothetical protein
MSEILKTLRNGGHIIKLQRKEYVLYSGLLAIAHENGLESIESTLLHWDHGERSAVFRATVKGARGTFQGHGDADPSNVNRGMAGATLRMAETRAICRALRCYLGIGMTAAEELPGKDNQPEPVALAPAPRPRSDMPVEDAIKETTIPRPPQFWEHIKEISPRIVWADILRLCDDKKQPYPHEWSQERRAGFVAKLKAGKFPTIWAPGA